MSPFSSLLDQFRGKRALVVGDLMLDDYIFGTASRISPEAPVMVIRQSRTKAVPGGAANVALNVAAMGGEATVLGVVGDDEAGTALRSSLQSLSGVAPVLVVDSGRVTTRKTRIVADHSHQVLRVDNETTEPVTGTVAERLAGEIEARVGQSDVLVLSDYLKGALVPEVVQVAMTAARSQGKPVVVNPKPVSAAQYSGASVLTLNKAEALQLTGIAAETEASDAECAHRVIELTGAVSAVVTLGERGMIGASGEGLVRMGAPRVEVYDTAGAGDTVIATLALCQACGEALEGSLALAVQTSARVVRHVGVAVPNERDLAEIRGL